MLLLTLLFYDPPHPFNLALPVLALGARSCNPSLVHFHFTESALHYNDTLHMKRVSGALIIFGMFVISSPRAETVIEGGFEWPILCNELLKVRQYADAPPHYRLHSPAAIEKTYSYLFLQLGRENARATLATRAWLNSGADPYAITRQYSELVNFTVPHLGDAATLQTPFSDPLAFAVIEENADMGFSDLKDFHAAFRMMDQELRYRGQSTALESGEDLEVISVLSLARMNQMSWPQVPSRFELTDQYLNLKRRFPYMNSLALAKMVFRSSVSHIPLARFVDHLKKIYNGPFRFRASSELKVELVAYWTEQNLTSSQFWQRMESLAIKTVFDISNDGRVLLQPLGQNEPRFLIEFQSIDPKNASPVEAHWQIDQLGLNK